MSLGILDQAGATLVPRTMSATPEALRKAIAPSRAPIVLAAACLLPWDWRADLCAAHGIPLVLGHALSRKALHGGTATNEKSDAHPSAVRLRGGRLPQASVSPAERRATRDLRRRRLQLARQRGARLAHVHQTNRPSPLPAIGTNMADHTHRDGVAERCADPAVPKRIAVARALLTSDEALRRDGARTIVPTATHPDAQTLSLRHTVPGLGTSLRLGRRDAIHPIARGPRVQAGASSCRLVTCATAAAGKRAETSGTPRGTAPRTRAFSDAAVCCLREHPAGQQCLARWENKQRPGQAWTIVAPPWARAVSDL